MVCAGELASGGMGGGRGSEWGEKAEETIYVTLCMTDNRCSSYCPVAAGLFSSHSGFGAMILVYASDK